MLSFDEIKNDSLRWCTFCEKTEKFIIHETENFYIVFDTFPLSEMHLMIVSKEHFGCMGEVYQEFDDELQDLINKTKFLFTQDLTIYEHGRAGSCTIDKNGKKCHHFHLHFLPITTNFYKHLDSQYKYKTLKSYREIYDNCAKYGDYILYSSQKEIRFYYTEDREVQSHLMRTLIANHINKPERADWESYTDIDILNKNYQNITKLQNLINPLT